MRQKTLMRLSSARAACGRPAGCAAATPVAANSALASAGPAIEVPGSPMPPGASPFSHEMDLDRGRFVDPHHPIIVEVALLHPAFRDRDLVIERGRESEDEAALDLRLDAVGIDDGAAIDRRRHAADRDLAVVVDLRLDDRRDIGAEHALAGAPRVRPAREARRPKPPFPPRDRGRREAAAPSRDVPAERRPDPAPRRAPARRRSFRRRRCCVPAHASPEAGRHAGRLGAHVFDMKVRRVVGKIDRAVDRVRRRPRS